MLNIVACVINRILTTCLSFGFGKWSAKFHQHNFVTIHSISLRFTVTDEYVGRSQFAAFVVISQYMMTPSNRNIFRFTGPLCGEFTGHWWIHPQKGQWRRALIFSLACTWINRWVNNREAGCLRRHRAHYDVIIMILSTHWQWRIFGYLSTRSAKCSYISTPDKFQI